MQKRQVFQPFTDRLSRDIRNALSRSFVTVLRQKSISSAQSVAQYYLNDRVEPCYQEYIKNRLKRYNTVLAKLGDENPEPLLLALLLWDEKLFFEVHEVLQHAAQKTYPGLCRKVWGMSAWQIVFLLFGNNLFENS